MKERRRLELQARLLRIDIIKCAYIAHNKIRESEGKALAYDEEAFMNLANEIDTIVMELNRR